MCDRITQIQEQINQLAEHMCNSVGFLQQSAAPSILPGRSELVSVPPKKGENDLDVKGLPLLFASNIAQCMKELDLLIDRLPLRLPSDEEVVTAVQNLQADIDSSKVLFEKTVGDTERKLTKIRSALHDISMCEMEIDKLKLDIPR